MTSIGEYRSDIKRYKKLKDKIWRIIENLESASRIADKLENEVSSSFKINNLPAKVSDRIDILGRDMRDTASYLRDSIIPSIDRAIEHSYDEIEDLESEEDE